MFSQPKTSEPQPAAKQASARRLLEISRAYWALSEQGQQKLLQMAEALADDSSQPKLDG